MNKKIIHFIGIGGIGMSALARWYLRLGYGVSGSDEGDSPLLRALRKEGAHIFIGHKKNHIVSGIEKVVYSQAVITRGKKQNPEIREAKKRVIPIQSYPETLGVMSKEKYTIAVCGTHGKSTTTGLAAVLLEKAKYDPTVIVGATVPEFRGSNFHFGHSRYAVIEADEFGGAFLRYRPSIIIVTTIDRDHLDYFKSFQNIRSHFKKFLSYVPVGGIIIANRDDKNVYGLVKKLPVKAEKIFYSLRDPYAKKIRRFMRLMGEHNVSNALAVYALSKKLGIPRPVFEKTIRSFAGVGRRMEYKGKCSGALLYDDYGHHPTEIRATLSGLRQKYCARLKKGKLWCVYQPHQYQRTMYLFNEFSRAFRDADIVVMLDVYSVPGREKESIRRKVNSKKLTEAIAARGKEAFYMPSYKEASAMIKKSVRKYDIVVVMGAGDVWKIWKYFQLRN